MSATERIWAVVLAAGEGTRLASLTRDARGAAVPKQFCSLNGGRALLDEALQRARHVAPAERVCAIVAQQHSSHWRWALRGLASGNIIVQPHNRGTAHGILLTVLTILARDPFASIVFFPADHFVLDEQALAGALRDLTRHLTRNSDGLALIGIEPDDVDPELGYIVPGSHMPDGSCAVARFVEKPPLPLARQLIEANALWNSFIFAAAGNALLALLRAHLSANAVEDMATALARDAHSGGSVALTELYQRLSAVDFSRAVVQNASASLRVIRAPACGWNDLGTPRRVADSLRRLAARAALAHGESGPAHILDRPGLVNLAVQHERLAVAS